MRTLVAITLLSAVALGTVPAAASAGSAPARPNVVVIMTDDQTVESLRVMPNVQSLLAARGTTFRNNFATYPLCCPSRATFLTGQYPHNHGVLSNQPPTGGFTKLDGSSTLPVWLQGAGYQTGHIGKYLNGYGRDNPTLVPPGWTEWYGSTDPSTYRMYGYQLNENGVLRTFGTDPASYQTDVYAAKAVDFIARRAPGEAPFFLSVAPLAPHSEGGQGQNADRNPRPAPRHIGRFQNEAVPRPPSFDEEDVSDKPAFVRRMRRLDGAALAGIEKRYRSRLESLLAVDDMVAGVVGALEASGELANTMIVFTSDNGFFGGEHRIRTGKVQHYEESTRVPLVIRGPGIPEGQVRDQLAGNIDLAPTIVDAAGATPGRVLDGRSLRPLAADPDREAGRDLLFETQTYAAIRTPRYKYVEYNTGEKELYDLVADPFELQSRHGDPAFAFLQAELARRLAPLRGCVGTACQVKPSLLLRVTYSAGKGPNGVSCVRSTMKPRIVGTDPVQIVDATFFLRGRRLGKDTAAPFIRRASRLRLARTRTSLFQARLTLADGQTLSLSRAVPRRCK